MELFNPHSKQWLKNKFKFYEKLRNQPNLYFSEKYKMFVCTKYEDVLTVLNNDKMFRSSQGNLIVEDPHRFGRTLGASDNPTHDIYKKIALSAYSKDNIKRISDVYRNIVKKRLSNSNIVNISDIADFSSAHAVGELLSIPYDRDTIVDLIIHIQRHSSQCIRDNSNSSGYDHFRNILNKCLEDKKQSLGIGLYNEYLKYDIKVPSLFTGPTISGASSLSGAVELMVIDLCKENQLDILLENLDLIPDAVNESLRYNSSTGRFSRTVSDYTIISNTELSPGTRLAICLDSANRDPAKFNDPNVFNIFRNSSKHLAWGYGLHACIALAISKSLMTVFLEELLTTFGKYKIITKDIDYLITASGNNDKITNLVIQKI